jgi:hypothetical protein
MLAGQTPTVVIRAGGSVTVEGWDSDRVQAETDSRWGLQLARRKAADSRRERARAKIGEHVLFDISFDNPFNAAKHLKKDLHGEVIEVQLGGDGRVRVPFGSDLVVYAVHSAEVQRLQGRVTATAGDDLSVHEVEVLAHAAAGRDLAVDCATLAGSEFKFGAGRDLRFYVHTLTDAQVTIKDLGSYWEAILGNGRIKVQLTAGGEVTLVTDQEVQAQPPNFILGNIEKPTPAAETTDQD